MGFAVIGAGDKDSTVVCWCLHQLTRDCGVTLSVSHGCFGSREAGQSMDKYGRAQTCAADSRLT